LINLFTTYYNEKNPERAEELRTCLVKNKSCNSISNIHVLSEVKEDKFLLKHNFKIRIIYNRPTFNDFINEINLISSDEDINIIANADIYFDQSLDALIGLSLQGRCFALTRWDVRHGGRVKLIELANSQDVWIFQGNITGIAGEIPIGVPGCDNRLAYEIRKAGYCLSNPSISIKSYHLHNSNYRPNEHRWYSPDYSIGGPHQHVIPDTIENVMKSDSIFSIIKAGKLPDQLYSAKVRRWYKQKENIEYSKDSFSKGYRLQGFFYRAIGLYYKFPFVKIVLLVFFHDYYKKNFFR